MDRTGYADRFEAVAADPRALLRDPAFLKAYGLGRGERLANLLERDRPLAGQRVLDLGAGYGALSVPLADRGARVVAVDVLDHRLRVTRERARLAAHGGVTVARIDAFNAPALPFAPDSFDLVVINGVLEYAGLARADRPERVQARILAEAFRVLRPDGMIYWAVENRFSVTYLYGPGHDGLWWSSLMPRRLARVYSRMLKGAPYVMCEPSYFELRRRLREAGFGAIRVHGGIMNYNNFTQVLDLEARSPRGEVTWPAGSARAARLVLGLGLGRYFWPNFMAIARKRAS
jgi:SAM-dependent methyltransferase